MPDTRRGTGKHTQHRIEHVAALPDRRHQRLMKTTSTLRTIESHAPHPSAADFFPGRLSLRALKQSAENCRGCGLYRHATQTVFGAGPATAKIVIVGEVPGDQEDLQGKPFVGPAGKLLDRCLLAAGISRQEVYLTNAVKHFKWTPRGKRRLHAKPSAREISACRPWLKTEIALVQPRTIVCLGATAAQTLLGRSFRLTQHLGEPVQSEVADQIYATYHPSAILRAPDPDERKRLTNLVVRHLKLAAR
jgi:DNA polymerase